jgi:hypothetical protein
MTDEVKERNYVKDIDYKTYYADGIILQISGAVGRLIFYESELNPSEDEKSFETDKKNIKLKFEIRIPNFALASLAENIITRNNLRNNALEISYSSKDDKTREAWSKYNNKLQEIIMDTEELFPINKLESLQQYFEDIIGRSTRAKNKDES